jgi:hypothetical protein
VKVSRIAEYLDEPRSSEVWAMDAAPNLLLVDWVRRKLGNGLAEVGCTEDVGRMLGVVNRILDPLVAAVDERCRVLLALLIEHRAAPSPFCVKMVEDKDPSTASRAEVKR